MGWWRTVISEKNAQLIASSQSSEALFASNKEFDALLESIRTGKQMKQEFGINADTEMRVVGALLQAVYGVKERNRIEGYNQQFVRVSFSSDGKIVAAASEDGSIKLWDLDGQEQATINNRYNPNVKKGNYFVSSVSFNPKNNIIAAASEDSDIKFWNFKGQKIQNLPGKGKNTILTSISPDATTIATVNLTDKIQLWKRTGQQISLFSYPLKSVSLISALSFSPDINSK
ncbi:WD40 repeat domain-containing protein [Nostoc sp.]|uniref:WD40 repeat domain-containing protein n=1 Tax=Nostoc sp. TaxID=1180 RepID=UPI002FFBF5A7